MDNRIANDMISSGMIPSGEKKKEDLSRTQYGSAPSPNALLDAYKSMYDKKEEVINEHHKKDADGNTIPHEGEELNETLMGTVARGLRGASRVSKNLASKASTLDKGIQAQGGLKNVAQKKLQSAKTKLAPTSGQKEALLGRTTAGKITRGVGALAAANIAGRMSQDKPSGGYSSYSNMQNFHYVPDGDTLSEDLFDALKSALIEEGCDEKNAMKIMASVTPDYFNEIIEEENLDEVVFTGSAMLAGLAAKKLLGAAAAKGLKTGATMLAKKAAVKTMGMGARGALKTISKKGLAGAADKALGSAAMSTVKNPVNTMVGASLLKPTPKIPKPMDPRQKMTGARTAGVYASADLFDIVKGQLLDEGIDEKDALKIMVELSQQDLNTIVNEGIGQMKLLPTAAALGGAAVATKMIASRMGKKSGEESIKPDKPNKPSLMQKIKTSTDAKNKAIEQM